MTKMIQNQWRIKPEFILKNTDQRDALVEHIICEVLEDGRGMDGVVNIPQLVVTTDVIRHYGPYVVYVADDLTDYNAINKAAQIIATRIINDLGMVSPAVLIEYDGNPNTLGDRIAESISGVECVKGKLRKDGLFDWHMSGMPDIEIFCGTKFHTFSSAGGKGVIGAKSRNKLIKKVADSLVNGYIKELSSFKYEGNSNALNAHICEQLESCDAATSTYGGIALFCIYDIPSTERVNAIETVSSSV